MEKIADSLGIPFTQEDNELLKGVSRVRSLEIILDIGNVTLSQIEKKSVCFKNKDYLSYIEKMNESEILPGVVRVLNF